MDINPEIRHAPPYPALMPHIYLDNAATTRVDPKVAEVVAACMLEDFGNPASAHASGITAERRVKAAAAALLRAIGDEDGRAGDLLWTSGGTESDALGVLGPARARAGRGKRIVHSAVEHAAVRNSATQLEREGWTVDTLPVDGRGVPVADAVEKLVDTETTVLAIMLVNNELGTVLPVSELARRARDKNPAIHVHCDAVQALGKLPIDVSALGVDSIAFAAHKLHGPKGVGALWLRKGARLAPLWGGGGQQDGLRTGTLNVPGIAGFGAAIGLAQADLEERRERWQRFADRLIQGARAAEVPMLRNGEGATTSPHILSLAFPGLVAGPLLHTLESRGLLVSAGSACSERNRKQSAVLAAIGLAKDAGTLRFSFGRETTADEVDRAADILTQALRDFHR